MPVTYYMEDRFSPAFEHFLAHYDQLEAAPDPATSRNVWIIKPGENSNCGYGITVHSSRTEILEELRRRFDEGRNSVIVQKYLENCFLIYGRKFDIRCYLLVTTVNGHLKGYWYNDGYIRTCSEAYDLSDTANVMVHLTNNSVQKNGASFGKYEDFNKMTFESFEKYLGKQGHPAHLWSQAYEQMKLIAHYMVAAVSPKIRRKQYTFEVPLP